MKRSNSIAQSNILRTLSPWLFALRCKSNTDDAHMPRLTVLAVSQLSFAPSHIRRILTVLPARQSHLATRLRLAHAPFWRVAPRVKAFPMSLPRQNSRFHLSTPNAPEPRALLAITIACAQAWCRFARQPSQRTPH